MGEHRPQTLGGVITAEMGSLQDLKTYVTAVAMGMLSSSGFIWLVTDAPPSRRHRDVRRRHTPLQRASTDVLSRQRYRTRRRLRPRQEHHPNPNPNPNSGLNTTDVLRIGGPRALLLHPSPSGARALSTTAFEGPGTRVGVSRPTNVWSDPPSYAAYTRAGNGNGATDGSSTTLDSLGQTLYPLFCVRVHEHAWMAAEYGVWGNERCLERFKTCLDCM
jgi:superoxide dismutase, Fe-Mn family